jgi:hypothetical protein
MHPLCRWFRPGRELLALLLLTTLVVGEVADARHHLSEHGCAADTGGRDDNCTCASLHAVSLASDLPAQAAPVELERQFMPVAIALAPTARAIISAAPRAPPQG